MNLDDRLDELKSVGEFTVYGENVLQLIKDVLEYMKPKENTNTPLPEDSNEAIYANGVEDGLREARREMEIKQKRLGL